MKDVSIYCYTIVLLLVSGSVFGQVPYTAQSFFNDSVAVMLPDNLVKIEHEAVKATFSTDTKDFFAYKNDSDGIIFTIKKTDREATQATLPEIEDRMAYDLKSQLPAAIWKSEGLTSVNGRKIAFNEFYIPDSNFGKYYFTFYTDFKGRLLVFSFECSKKDANQSHIVAKKIMNNLKIQ
ncbi:hypothetical protein [Flavobacterium rhizosphaerae]|uniref:DUF1795 domain-containing protein n=1 Tax=Flavobacterium rhizosphaerae TaxID=3163298 RepID=A0ABW8YVN2_9FLAO